jgi:hypothetical protein
MANRTDRLIVELRIAVEAKSECDLAIAEARAALASARSNARTAASAVDEIQQELITGRSSRPLLDAAEARSSSVEDESADERQRGPVRREVVIRDHEVISDGKPKRGRGRPKKQPAAEGLYQ